MPPPPPPPPPPRQPESFSLTLVFDFDPRLGLTVGEHEYPDCPVGQKYNQLEGECRAIACPKGEVLEGNDCIPQPSTIIVEFEAVLESPINSTKQESLQEGTETLDSRLNTSAQVIFNQFNISRVNFEMQSDVEAEETRVKVTVNISCNCDYASLLRPGATGTGSDAARRVDSNFRMDLLRTVREEILKFTTDQKVDLAEFSAELKFEIDNSSLSLSTFDNCTWFVFNLDEIQFTNTTTDNETTKTVEITETAESFPPERYEVLDNAVIICLEPSYFRDDGGIPFALGVVSLICIGISIVCLVARIALQFCVARFQTKPGKLHFHLSWAFLIAFVFLLLGPFLAHNEPACVFAAAVLCYGFFAAFTWMNIIALDTWLVFRPSGAFARSGDSSTPLVRYIAPAWLIPLVLVGIIVGINYSGVDETYRPMFGGARCWFTQRMAMLVYFGLPIAVSILLNAYLYISTSINLHRAFNTERARLNRDDHHFFVYVRLFILMGFTWIFGFLSAFLDVVAIDFIFVLLTALQGLFLFLSFVCNRHVIGDVKKKIKGEVSSSSGGRRTKETPASKTGSGESTSSGALASPSPTPKPGVLSAFSFPAVFKRSKSQETKATELRTNADGGTVENGVVGPLDHETGELSEVKAESEMEQRDSFRDSNGNEETTSTYTADPDKGTFTMARITMMPPPKSPDPEPAVYAVAAGKKAKPPPISAKPPRTTPKPPPIKPKPSGLTKGVDSGPESDDRGGTPPPVPPKPRARSPDKPKVKLRGKEGTTQGIRGLGAGKRESKA